MAVTRIVVSGKTYTADQWKKLPLTERVKLISSAATFFDGDKPVDTKTAIAQLR